MKIMNLTPWRSEDLRYIVSEALAAHGVASTGLTVHAIARKRLWARGWNDGKHAGLVDGRVITDRYIDLNIPRPAKEFDPASIEHAEMVVMLARWLDAVVVMLKQGGKPVRDWDSKPIEWLFDWYSVRTGPKGRAAGCPMSPLMPTPIVSKAEKDAEKLAHARAMLKKAKTRTKRATTLEKGWARTVRALERKT